ncbi:hypothetical protein RUM44_013099 [Polyplax serrata]|uniref:Daxx histone-binding domain-containing protein n=1 Tax=Polyplax serrata TaxID=468196 RepID=A0ABR1BD65_POLSC
MDTNDVIILSSDEEEQCLKKLEKESSTQKNKHNQLKYNIKQQINDDIPRVLQNCSSNCELEIVDLAENTEISFDLDSNKFKSTILNHNKKSNPGLPETKSSSSLKYETDEQCNQSATSEIKILSIESLDNKIKNDDFSCQDIIVSNTISKNDNKKQLNTPTCHINNSSKFEENKAKTKKLFDEFVERCTSFEDIPNDRIRLSNKLYKKYSEAGTEYINSDEFLGLIQKCTKKLEKNNLYFLAKEVTDELCNRKKIQFGNGVITSNDEFVDGNELQNQPPQNEKKKKKIIKKILSHLDTLGMKIKELENAEVDLSDEEDSSYVQLQRYRKKFCSLYKKFCKLTNEVSDASRIYSRKICFSGSKYPEINRCIENWLNKTRRFPDFSDILKLLENQSSSLGLQYSSEGIRVLATEIFQQVGVQLQRRRQYDLWDTLSGFLTETEDPAESNPELQKVLNTNFEVRVKKEQEIITYFAELQEKQKIMPVEVPDDEANESPNQSDDESEIEEAGNSVNEKLNEVLDKEYICDMETGECKDSLSESENESVVHRNQAVDYKCDEQGLLKKETKNNYKNCKSLKRWEGTNNAEISESNLDTDAKDLRFRTNDGTPKMSNNVGSTIFSNNESLKTEKNNIGLANTSNETVNANHRENSKIFTKTPVVQLTRISQPPRKHLTLYTGCTSSKKRKLSLSSFTKSFHLNETHNEKSPKQFKPSFDVRHCQIQHNFKSIKKLHNFKSFTKQTNIRVRKHALHGLTDISNLLKSIGKTKNFVDVFFSTFRPQKVKSVQRCIRGNFFRTNYKFTPNIQTCALGYGENTVKNLGDGAEESKINKDGSNSGSQRTEENSSFGGQGNGNEGDKNENDGNKKNENSEDKEEDKNEEEEEEENEDGNEDEKHSETMDLVTCELLEGPQNSDGSPLALHNPNKTEAKQGLESKVEPTQNRTTKSNKNRRTKSRIKKNLITAETTIGEEVVEAEVTLEENLSYDICNWSCSFDNDYSIGSSSFRVRDSKIIAPVRQKRKWSNHTSTPSDEERVQNFLLHSPSSISITPPKTMLMSKPPSQDVLKALATLKRLKGISTTRVRRTPSKIREEDIVVINEPNRKRGKYQQKLLSSSSSTRNGSSGPSHDFLPVITKVQSIKSDSTQDGSSAGATSATPCKPSKKAKEESNINVPKISNVWGGFAGESSGSAPNCSFPQYSQTNPNGTPKKKNTKKSVEYVELD